MRQLVRVPFKMNCYCKWLQTVSNAVLCQKKHIPYPFSFILVKKFILKRTLILV